MTTQVYKAQILEMLLKIRLIMTLELMITNIDDPDNSEIVSRLERNKRVSEEAITNIYRFNNTLINTDSLTRVCESFKYNDGNFNNEIDELTNKFLSKNLEEYKTINVETNNTCQNIIKETPSKGNNQKPKSRPTF